MGKKGLATKVARAKVVLEQIEKFTADRKELYQELDELVVELRDVPGLEEHGLQVTDAFAKGNTQWGHGPVRRFSIERVEAPAEAAVPVKSAKKPRDADK